MSARNPSPNTRVPHVALLFACLTLCAACNSPWMGRPDGFVCNNDAQCKSGEVCFIDGCGDPGKDIAVEVSPDARAGQAAQDFAIETLVALQDFRVVPTTALTGILRTAATVGPDDEVIPAAPYEGRVTIRLAGTSTVIPDLHRSANLTTELTDGRFTVQAASGTYVGTLTTADPRFPPLRFEVQIAPGTQQPIALELPDVASLQEITGRLTTLGLPLLGQYLQVEPLHPETLERVGQPVLSDPGSGTFVLSLAPDEDGMIPPVQLRITPTSQPASFPIRMFQDVQVDPEVLLDLEMGAPQPLVRLSGTLKSQRERPVAGATVYAEVSSSEDGTTFRSESVQSDVEGRFTLRTFPAPELGGRLWVVPPARDSTGQTRLPFSIGALPADLGELTLPYRTPVRIAVVDPETQAPEENAVVIADPIGRFAEDLPLPTYGGEGITTAEGVVLWLEPGLYRASVRRGPQRPRLTEVFAVPPASEVLEGPPPEQSVVIHTAEGRTVTGTVISKGEATTRPIAGAVIRYTRVLHLENEATHAVLAETTTAEDGTYSVTLPILPR